MGVIQFKKPETEESCDPHMSGVAICSACGLEHVAVVPVGVPLFECSHCGTMKARMKYDCTPASERIWECACGCDVFRVAETYFLCVNCGQGQEFHD